MSESIEHSRNELGIARYVGILPAIAGILTFSCLVFSVLYNIGYFSVYDQNIISILSVSDYIQSGIAFLPFSVGLFAIANAVSLFLIIAFSNEGKTDIVLHSGKYEYTKKIGPWVLIFVSVLASGGSIIFFSFRFLSGHTIVVLSITGWVLVLLKTKSHINLKFYHFALAVYFIPLLYITWATGHDSAWRDLKKTPNATIVFDDHSNLKVTILRITSDYVLYFVDYPHLLSRKTVSEIIWEKTYEFDSLACRFWGVCLNVDIKG
jgi:hypothetical protein